MTIRFGKIQDKKAEIRFFDQYSGDGYDVFDMESKNRLIDECLRVLGTFKKLDKGMLVADCGCGSGVFTSILRDKGFKTVGLDLSCKIIMSGKKRFNDMDFINGDVDLLPIASSSLDLILFSGMPHHLPEKSLCASEAFRVLKPGGAFVAFDPNKLNPFMWIYRDKSSPLHSSKGVSVNESPVGEKEIKKVFSDSGFNVNIEYLSGLHYRVIASSFLRPILPVYNFLDDTIFRPKFMRRHRAFLITVGRKPL
ncbi:MAG TPA: methyltransferase domain-containing protein [Victivallales bacterium]|nr:methyltransferase domain-containing protein [Victivallales bacterium]